MGKTHVLNDTNRDVIFDELVRLRLRGVTMERIGELMGFHKKTIHEWCSRPEFKAKLEKTKAELRKDLEKALTDGEDIPKNIEEVKQKYSFRGFQKIHDLMVTSENEKIQLQAAMDLADRGKDTSKIKKVQAQTWTAALTPELLVQMAATAKEIQEFGRIIPAASTEGLIEEKSTDDDDGLIVGDDDEDDGYSGDREDRQ
jgi:hypothetical protein